MFSDPCRIVCTFFILVICFSWGLLITVINYKDLEIDDLKIKAVKSGAAEWVSEKEGLPSKNFKWKNPDLNKD